MPDGWVNTGDQVIINESGDLFVVDRIKVLRPWLNNVPSWLTLFLRLITGSIKSERISSRSCGTGGTRLISYIFSLHSTANIWVVDCIYCHLTVRYDRVTSSDTMTSGTRALSVF